MVEITGHASLTLGFRAFDIHELLLHFIARELGHYRENGLNVALKDLTFLPEETPGIDFTVACGGALMGWTKGIRRKVVFVATDYPMFWLHSAPEITAVNGLKGARIASYPAATPPEQFHRMILRKHGLDPERDVALEAARDDAARLGLLKSGDVAAAVISSAIPPPKVQSLGFETLVFFGDEIRIPTTGLAVSEEFLEKHTDVVRAMTDALYQSLVAFHRMPEQVIPVLAQFLGDTPRIAEQTYRLVSNLFTKDGRAAPHAALNAVDLVNRQITAEQKLQASDIYDYSFLKD